MEISSLVTGCPFPSSTLFLYFCTISLAYKGLQPSYPLNLTIFSITREKVYTFPPLYSEHAALKLLSILLIQPKPPSRGNPFLTFLYQPYHIFMFASARPRVRLSVGIEGGFKDARSFSLFCSLIEFYRLISSFLFLISASKSLNDWCQMISPSSRR